MTQRGTYSISTVTACFEKMRCDDHALENAVYSVFKFSLEKQEKETLFSIN